MAQKLNKIEKIIAELCPKGVKFMTIGNICQINRGRVISKGYLKNNAGKYPVYSSQTVNSGVFGCINTYDYDGEYLTWTTDGANAGSIFYRNGKFSITNVCGLLKVKVDDVNIKFLSYILTSVSKKYVSAGMGNPKIMSNVMEKIKIPVPPVTIQKEIVKILDSFTELEAEIEAEIEAELKARKKQYEYYRENLLSFSDDVTRVSLNAMCTIGDGLHGTPIYTDIGKYYFINGNNLKDGHVVVEGKTKKVDDQAYKKHGISLTSNKTILMSINGTIGNIAKFNNENIVLGKSVAYFNIESESINVNYLFYYLQTSKAKQYYENQKTGSTIKNLGLKALREFRIPVPSIEEQEKIAATLEKFNKLANDISIGLPAELSARRQQYEYYRNKLLTFKEYVQ